MKVGVGLYPLFLKLEGKPVLVVGGGPVALSKLDALLEAGAKVTVVAPSLLPAFEGRGLTLRRRAFEPKDLEGVWWVVSAAPAAVNREVARAAEARRLFVNAVDDPSCGSAYLGGVVRKGGATVAVSTGGDAPALAGLLREALEAVLPDHLSAWVDLARALRPSWRAEGVPMASRRPLLLQALNRLYSGKEE